MKIKVLPGPKGRIPILLRDDDTNFFTRAEMLESVHSITWQKKFKISLSIIPNQKGINDVCVPPEYRESGLHYSLADNQDLTTFLKTKKKLGLIEILQHGYSHSPIEDEFRGEFGSNKKSKSIDVRSNLERGKSLIEQIFGGPPRFFVPPYDDISYSNINMVKQNNLIPVYGQENIHRFFRSPFIPSMIKKIMARRIFDKFARSAFIVPAAIDIKDEVIILSLSRLGIKYDMMDSPEKFLDSMSKLICSLTFNKNRRIPLCIINHYHQYFYDWSNSITRTEMFSVWKKLLDLLDKFNVGWKTTFEDLYSRDARIKKIKFSQSGSKITILFPENDLYPIEDLAFQIDGQLESNESIKFDEETRILTIKNTLKQHNLVLYLR